MDDPRFAAAQSRVENQSELYPIIERIVAKYPLADWLKRLSVGDVPHAPVLSVGEALEQDFAKTAPRPAAARRLPCSRRG